MEITKDVVVLYHGNCSDGFGAAWAAHKKFGDSAEYIQAFYSTPFSRAIINKEVYLLDFTGSREEMEWLLANNRSVTSIDHHESKKEEAKISTQCIFDITHSGAVLAWKYFHPAEPLPLLLQHVEDYDMWWHKLPDADPIRKYITAVGFNFQEWHEWDQLATDLEDTTRRQQIVREGQLIARYEKNIYDQMEPQAYLVEFEGHTVYAANAPGWFGDLLARRLYDKQPPFAIVWRENKDWIHISLRSDGSINVSDMAKKYSKDGGGHPGSAAFRLAPGTPLPWKRIQK